MVEPGKNIAIKVPLYKWAETVAFYRDCVGLEVIEEHPNSTVFAFGPMNLWIDRVEHQSQTDVWLELFSDDPGKALSALGSPNRDEVEQLEEGDGHWTCDPAGTILLLHKKGP